MEMTDNLKNKGFYRAFEDVYRGSRDLILSRLKIYIPFLLPLKQREFPLKAVDIGCGRGEWLEILKETGFDGEGVDLDDGMLNACAELGLNAIKEDALSYLQRQENESVSVVSGFHIAEHLSFDVLQNVVSEGLRILCPGGLLILETPNPENIVVATKNFHLDPTHQRPIPPELLSFLAEYTGFKRVKIVRLQEDSRLKKKNDLNILDIFSGVSPDYSIVAQKSASKEILGLFDSVFNIEYGVTLDFLILGMVISITQVIALLLYSYSLK